MNNKRLSIVYALLFIIGVLSLGFRMVGFPAVLFSIAFVGGFALWMATTYRTPIDPHKIIIPYLLTVILFIAHVYEEYLTHIEQALTQISGFHISEGGFLTIAAFLAPVIWLIGVLMILKRWHIGYFFVSTFLFGMMIGELSHFAFPFMEDGTFHYVSGMYTAILPVISGWYTFYITPREIRKSKQEHTPARSKMT